MKHIKAAPKGTAPVADAGAWQWQDFAACAGMPLDLFYGPAGEREIGRPVREQQALAVCHGCAVRTECLTSALQYPPADQHGVQGGMTADARREERRKDLRRVNGVVVHEKRVVTRRSRHPMVDATGTRRRLQALAAVGHGTVIIARRIGDLVHPSYLNSARNGDTDRVREDVAQALAAVYPHLCEEPPVKNSNGVAASAYEHGWAAPDEWTGQDLDDPNARPRIPEGSAA